ncbi:MAG: hypothetical protein GXX86_09215, partial [Propionibacterium sp.]|nr:hypothetical protein [Propionibacterium sp.]
LLAGALTALSPLLRQHTELAVGANRLVIPTWSAPLVIWILVVAMTLAATAIVHLHPVLKFVGWVSLISVMAPFITMLAHEPLVAFGLLAAGSGVLLVLIVVRWRASFHPAEFLVAGIGVTLGTVVPMLRARSAPSFGLDHRPMHIEGVLVMFVLFAMPLLLVTGYAMAQVTVRVATDLGPSLPGRALGVVAALLAVPALGLIGWNWWQRNELWTGTALLPAAMLVALLVLFAVPLWVRARVVGLPPVAEVDEGFGPWLYPIVLAIIAQNLPVFVMSQVTPIATVIDPALGARVLEWADVTQTDAARMLWRGLVAVGLLVAAWLSARRGRMAGPLAACAAAAVTAMGVLGTATGLPLTTFTGEALIEIAMVFGLAALAVRVVRRKVDQRVLVGLVGLFALAVAYPFRHLIAEPVDQLAGQAGGALVIFGVAWQVLTGAEFTRNSNRVAPAPSRVMLFAANIVLSSAVVAWVALTRRSTSVIDPAGYADTGDWMLGTPLLAAVAVLLVLQIATGGDARRIETREEEALEAEVEVHQQTGEVWAGPATGPRPGTKPPWDAPAPPR